MNSAILIYQNQDGNIKIDVRLEKELEERATMKKFGISEFQQIALGVLWK